MKMEAHVTLLSMVMCVPVRMALQELTVKQVDLLIHVNENRAR